MRGDWDCARKEALAGADCEPAAADRSDRGERDDDAVSLSRKRHYRTDLRSLAIGIRRLKNLEHETVDYQFVQLLLHVDPHVGPFDFPRSKRSF